MDELLTDHLNRAYKIPGFRSLQEEIVKSILDGRNVAAFLPTGMGKTLLYQVPTTFLKIKTVVISPLIALIRDQAERARKLNIPVFELHGLNTTEENQKSLSGFLDAGYGILILSPERWNLSVREIIENREPSIFLVIDEAHCISVWGQSFRPSYTEMTYDFKNHPASRLLVLSATPTKDLIALVKQQFNPENLQIFTGDLYRYNLAYAVRIVPSALGFLSEIVVKLKGSSILYHQSREGVEKLAALFNSRLETVCWFHAGLEKSEKQKQSTAFLSGKSDFMVATSAFGMGIDKADIRYIFHFDIPESIEEYLQETGRAGRDGKKSWIYLLIEEEQLYWLKKGIDEIEDWLKLEAGNLLTKPDFRSPYARKTFATILQSNYLDLIAESEFSDIPFFLNLRLETNLVQTISAESGEISLPEVLVHLYTGKIMVESLQVDLEKVSGFLGLSRQAVFHRIQSLAETGLISIQDQKLKLPFVLPAAWKSIEQSPQLLRTKFQDKLEKLKFWQGYLTGQECLMNLLVTGMDAGREGYFCGQCSSCLAKGETRSRIEDLDLLTDFLRKNSGKMSYKDILIGLSGVWQDENRTPLSKIRIDQVIQFGIKEGWFRENRVGNGSEIEFTG